MSSELEKTIERLIASELPNYEVCKQYSVRVDGGLLLFDFCIPALRIMIEVQGEQHYKFVQFFHGMIDNFNKAKARDNLKKEWCSKNGYSLIYFEYKEIPKLTSLEFRDRIISS